jgi:hypothetical protein
MHSVTPFRSAAAAAAGLAAGVFSNNLDEINTLSRGIKSGEGQLMTL